MNETSNQPKVTTIRAPNIPSIYINAIQVAMGSLELRLYLSETTPSLDGQSVEVTQKVCIVLTPEFAKALGQRLVENMAQFEQQFGKLRDTTPLDTPEKPSHS